jgi:hypothetical protein
MEAVIMTKRIFGWVLALYIVFNSLYISGIFNLRYQYQSYDPRTVTENYYQYDLLMLPNVHW